MAVMIRDMKMPGCCAACDFCGGLSVAEGGYICDCIEDVCIPDDIVIEGRPDWCPLEEVPDDLIRG